MIEQELVLDIKGDEIHFYCKGYDKEFIALIGNIITGRIHCGDKDTDKQKAKLNYIGVAGGDGPYPSKDDDECKQEAKLNYIGVAGGDGPYPSKDDDECKQEAKLNYIGVAGGDGPYP
ncbi:MAG: hypothetical protein ACYDDE_03915, partial [bacterium]